MRQRYYVRTIGKDGRHRLYGDYATRDEAQVALARNNRRRPSLARSTDSYVVAHGK